VSVVQTRIGVVDERRGRAAGRLALGRGAGYLLSEVTVKTLRGSPEIVESSPARLSLAAPR